MASVKESLLSRILPYHHPRPSEMQCIYARGRETSPGHQYIIARLTLLLHVACTLLQALREWKEKCLQPQSWSSQPFAGVDSSEQMAVASGPTRNDVGPWADWTLQRHRLGEFVFMRNRAPPHTANSTRQCVRVKSWNQTTSEARKWGLLPALTATPSLWGACPARWTSPSIRTGRSLILGSRITGTRSAHSSVSVSHARLLGRGCNTSLTLIKSYS